MSRPTLGFAGLGRMGGPLSRRLVEAGYELVGFDAAGTDQRLPAGAVAAESIQDLARATDVMLLSVPDGAVSQTSAGRSRRRTVGASASSSISRPSASRRPATAPKRCVQ